jgi:hypothetical protein
VKKRTEEIMKTVLRGRDIEKWRYKWADKWLIKIEAGWTNKNRGSQKPEEFFKKTFPSLYNYFMTFKGYKGKGRGLFNRDAQGDYWWELRPCDYYQEFEKEKVVWAETDQDLNTVIVPRGMYLQKTCFMIITEKPKLINALLNSKVSQWYIKQKASLLGKKGMSLTKDAVQEIPLPPITPQNQKIAQQIEKLVNKILEHTQSPDYETDQEMQAQVKELERQIDQLVYQLYGLTEDEIKIIEGM